MFFLLFSFMPPYLVLTDYRPYPFL
uniref:Uncharacterized protein n=1 Tax=Arundo donax TaxID=35708 RepID=A0A0A8Z6D9_ARUDO